MSERNSSLTIPDHDARPNPRDPAWQELPNTSKADVVLRNSILPPLRERILAEPAAESMWSAALRGSVAVRGGDARVWAIPSGVALQFFRYAFVLISRCPGLPECAATLNRFSSESTPRDDAHSTFGRDESMPAIITVERLPSARKE